MATDEGAATIGVGDLGTLVPGGLADVVVLGAGLIKDIHDTEAIRRVIKGGRLFDPEKLGTQAAAGPKEESK